MSSNSGTFHEFYSQQILRFDSSVVEREIAVDSRISLGHVFEPRSDLSFLLLVIFNNLQGVFKSLSANNTKTLRGWTRDGNTKCYS